jgi:antirestriction protein
MTAMIEAYVTNLGRYNEGSLDGEYLKLPATTEEVQALLQRIHVDGVRYEEIFITDYDTNLAGMQNLGENESIDELNYLASLLSDLEDWELEKFEAAAVYGDHSGSVKDLINLAQNLDCYELYPNVSDNDDLGRYLIDELGYEEIPDHLANYIDYGAYGRDFSINENGEFVDGGYVLNNGGTFTEYYDGLDIPDEYKIFAYPQPEKSIKKAIANYQQMISDAPAAPERPHSAHTER